MAVKLIAPGMRKNNKFYLLRAYVGDREIELSTKTTDRARAEIMQKELDLELAREKAPGAPIPSADVTWSEGADLYLAWRNPSKVDCQRIDKIKASSLGEKNVRAVTQADIVAAANEICDTYVPGLPHNKRNNNARRKAPPRAHGPATKNRNVINPARAVLHYCAESGYCGWLRVKGFKQPRAKTRALAAESAIALIANVPLAVARDGKLLHGVPTMIGNRPATEKDRARAARQLRMKRLLLVWLFRQGNRISDALRMAWPSIDLAAGTVDYHTGKGDRDIAAKALHEEVVELLAAVPEAERHGALFPWRTRHGVYKWLRPYVRSLGINFTPHMARHSVGKWLNEGQASLRTIMDTLDHLDAKSSIRYQSTDVEVIRAAGARMPALKAIAGGKR